MNKLRVIRRSNENKSGLSPLFVSFYINREKIRIPLGISCYKKEWDTTQECFVGRSQKAADNNLIIQSMLARISDIFVEARLRKEKLTVDEFKKRFKEPGDYRDFFGFARNYYRLISKGNADNTNKVHKSVLKKLQEYTPTLAFSDITPEFLKIYATYLRRIGNADTTIWKNLSTLKIYIRAAVSNGYIRTDPFTRYRVKHPRSDISYLSEQELQSLISLYRSGQLPKNEQNVLRFFLFMTFTSLHIGDARQLQVESIFSGELHYVRIKTRAIVTVPMSSPAMQLYEYYKGKRSNGPLIDGLPSDQAINRILKRIAAKAGISKDMTAKTARHTFATIYCSRNNGDITTLSRIMGHSNINMTMIYAHTMKQDRLTGIQVFNDLL